MIRDARSWGKKNLSEDVHSSSTAAFRATFIPSLRYPSLLSVSVFGHVSLHSPQLLSWVILMSYYFVAVVFRFLLSEQAPVAFQGVATTKTTDSLFVAVLTYQEIVASHLENLPPPLEFPDEESETRDNQ